MRTRLALALVLAAVGAATAQQLPELQPQATGTGAITGLVVEAGTNTPVAGARLWLSQTRGETPRGVYPRSEHLTTDTSGAFDFRALPAGQFSIQASMDGFQPGGIGKRRPEGDDAWITLNAGQTFSEARIELFRGGTISGVVTNHRGEPMSGVGVGTWKRIRSGELKRGSEGRTNAAGEYRLTAVEPGDHLVAVQVWHDTMRQGPPATEPNACEVVLPRPPGAPPVPTPKPKYAVGEWFATQPRWMPEPGPDDQGRPQTIATTIYPGVSEVSGALNVSVANGEDRIGIDLQLLTPMSGDDWKPGFWDDDAQISAEGLIAGGYALRVSDNAAEARWFVRSIKLRGTDLITRPIAIQREDVSGVEVTMTDRPSPLDGQVVDASGTLVRDATVVVFPVNLASWPTAHDDLDGFERARSLDGNYRFEHLVPGDYFVAAVDERRMGDWPRSGFLEAIAKQASPVRIVHGERQTLKLVLRAIPEPRRN